jgi:hypothetical protein
MEFIGKGRATRRTVVIGGIAAGALAVVDPVCRQAGAAPAVASPAPRDDTSYSLHGVTIADRIGRWRMPRVPTSRPGSTPRTDAPVP